MNWKLEVAKKEIAADETLSDEAKAMSTAILVDHAKKVRSWS